MGIIRKTKSLSLVLDAFQSKDNALSVVKLVDMMNHFMNKTTVYRILDRLENEGLVHSFLGKDGLKWYAKCLDCSSNHHSDTHPHFQCTDCGIVECLPVNISIPKLPNVQINSAEIMLSGRCSNCNT